MEIRNRRRNVCDCFKIGVSSNEGEKALFMGGSLCSFFFFVLISLTLSVSFCLSCEN